MLAGSVANAEMAHAFVNLAKTTGKWCVDAVKQEREREPHAARLEACVLGFAIPSRPALRESSFLGLSVSICKMRGRAQRLETEMYKGSRR